MKDDPTAIKAKLSAANAFLTTFGPHIVQIILPPYAGEPPHMLGVRTLELARALFPGEYKEIGHNPLSFRDGVITLQEQEHLGLSAHDQTVRLLHEIALEDSTVFQPDPSRPGYRH